VPIQERIKHLIDRGLSPDKSILDIMLDRKYVDPTLPRIGELQWVVFLLDPEYDATIITALDSTELATRYVYLRHKYQSGNESLPMRSTISSLGGDHIPVPIQERDIAEQTVGRLTEIYEHLALRDRVLWRGQVVDATNNGRPVIIPSDRILESVAPVPPPLSSSRSNVNAQVGFADDEESNNDGENAAPAAGGLLQLVMTMCRVPMCLMGLMMKKEIVSLIVQTGGVHMATLEIQVMTSQPH
jgi:hypothetical protein